MVRSLLQAEAMRLRLPAGAVNFPTEVFARDGGIDAMSNLAEDPLEPFPNGACAWQVKDTTAIDVAKELAKPAVVEAIQAGRAYVLVCGQPMYGDSRERLQGELDRAVGGIRADSRAVLIGIDDLERMCELFPSLPANLGGPASAGTTLEVWGRPLDVASFPFAVSPDLEAKLEQIRSFARNDDKTRAHLHVFGDSGVGKSRAVFEALNVDDLRERVAANEIFRGHLPDLLRELGMTQATVIVVVDEVSQSQASELRDAASLGEGRIRLITIGDRHDRTVRPDAWSLEILPLPEGIVQELVTRVTGLVADDAGYIARLSEGYPKLAVVMAASLAEAGGRGNLIDLIRGARVSELLSAMIQDETIKRHLAHLALVYRLGFDEELAGETQRFCAAFDLGHLAFRASIIQETGRLVATAGRYRRVSPQALAVWLAQGLIAAEGDRVIAGLGQLPEPLFESFRQQLQELGGDETFEAALKEVLGLRADRFRTLRDLTSPDASFLSAIAFAAPDVAGEVLASLFDHANSADIKQLPAESRRALVWAAEHLLWFATTYEVAASCLLALASFETETWSNNASGVLAGSFQMNLGGTELPLGERLAWIRKHAHDHGTASVAVAVQCADKALEWNQTRTGGWRGGRIQPVEWGPRTSTEINDLHRIALEALVEWATDAAVRPAIAKVLAQAVWVFARTGRLVDLAAAVTAVTSWSPDDRAEILAALRRQVGLGGDQLSDADRAVIASLSEELQGNGPAGRLATVLATEIWDLASARADPEPPPALVELAADLASRDASTISAEVSTAEGAKDSTLFALFRILGRDHPSASALAEDRDLPPVARIGAVAGIGETSPGEAKDIIAGWADDPGQKLLVPWAVATQTANSELVATATSLVMSGEVALSELNRFRYGRWTEPLTADAVGQIIDCYLSLPATTFDIDAALGLLASWLEQHPESAGDLTDRGLRLIELAANAPDRGGSLAFIRNLVATRLNLDPIVRLDSTLRALAVNESASREDLEAIGRAAEVAPLETAERVLRFLLDQRGPAFMLESDHLLSVVGAAAGQELLGLLRELEVDDQRRALRHFNFVQPRLDPVVIELMRGAEDDSPLWQELSQRFAIPGEVVMGPYSFRLVQRRDQLLAMASDATTDEGIRSWARRTAEQLEPWIAKEQLREAEDH